MTRSASCLAASEVAAIYGTYGDLMQRRCRVILRDDALADDALQEAFVNLIRYGAAFRDVQAKLRWLYRLCDRSCFAQLRKRKRQRELADESRAARPEPIHSHPTHRVEHRDQVLKVLGALGERERQVAVLAWVDGLSQGEIGRQLGWSRQTVNKKLARIRKVATEITGEHQ